MSIHQNLRPRLAWPMRCSAIATLVVAVAIALAPASAAQAPSRTLPAEAAIDAILKDLSTYDGGIESSAVWVLRDYVNARRDDPAGRAECEGKLLQFLTSTATPAAKMAATRHLRLIAGESAVPQLQALLADERAADLALYVLRQIPGEASEKAVVQALGTAAPATQMAVISELGDRRAAGAVPALALRLHDPALAAAAAMALGRIGGTAATAALVAAYQDAAGDLRTRIASSLMNSAEGFLTAKDPETALRLYEPLASDQLLPPAIRRAAAMGRISASGPRGAALLLTMLTGSDPELQTAAIAKLREVVSPDGVGPICAAVLRLPMNAQVQVVAALEAYPPDRVRPVVLDAARSESAPVRLAALKALQAVGGAADVPVLASMAVRTRGAEQAAARATLSALKGRAVDDAIIAELSQAPADEVAPELLLAIGTRRIFVAKPLVASMLDSPSAALRVTALKTLRAIGTPSDIPRVLTLLIATSDVTEQAEAGNTVAALAQRIANADSQTRTIRARIAAEEDANARVRLIGVLPAIGDSTALPVLRTSLADPDPAVADAAVRALASWPAADAREDLMRLARDSRNETHRLLAITGLVRIIGHDRSRDPEAAVSDLRLAAGFAWRPEEYRLVLGALMQFPSQSALDLATSFLAEPSVKAEAQAAIEKIAARLPKKETTRK